MLQADTKAAPIQPLIRFPAILLLLAWSAFVVYGSLVPFNFQAVSFYLAVQVFLALADQAEKVRSFTDWATNIAIFVPLGFLGFAAVSRDGKLARAIANALLVMGACVMLSISIECTQIFFPPRDSSVFDIIANAAGASLGVLGWYVLGDETVAAYTALVKMQHGQRVPSFSGNLRAALSVGCVLFIAGWGGFFTASWAGWDVGMARMEGIHLLPFAQHQAANIGLALVSTAMAAVVYASLGSVLWLLNVGRGTPLRARLIVASMSAAGIAILVEGLKLFLPARSPDTANIVIAGLAASLGYLFSPLATKLFIETDKSPALPGNSGRTSPPATAKVGLWSGRAIALICAAATFSLVVTYPIGQIQLALALLAYGLVLVRYSTAWLVVIPALLPVLDLAPWTGRFFVDEYDGVVLTTLAVGLWRAAGRPLAVSPGRVFWLLLAGFAVSFLASTVIGLMPLQPLDANAFTSYYSHYAALRSAKGLLFAAGLAVLISSHLAAGLDVKRVFSAGMIVGLVGAAASVIWERVAYAVFMNFSTDFRAVGLFSTMHTGGAHLDAFLVTALPFAAIWALRTPRPTARFAALLLFSAGTYAVMMTFSRAAVAALLLAVLVIAAWAFLTRRRMAGSALTAGIKIAIGLAVGSLVISPVIVGSFMQARFTTTSADLEIRNSHWNEAVGMMTDNLRTSLLGMGLGRFPETYLLLSRNQDKPAVHRFETEANNTFMRIHHGARLYVEQIVAVEPRRDYTIALKARTLGQKASVNVLLCDRTFLDGFGCQSATFQISGEAGKWQQFQATINSAAVGENGLRLSKLTLENAGSEMPVDLDEVSLIDSGGTNHIVNGNFQDRADRWFFSTPNNHLPWHIKNLWLEIFFEQGWLGLVMFCALCAALVTRLALRAAQGAGFAAVLLAALVGFFAVGAFDSVFDAPRLILLFGLLVAGTVLAGAQPHTANDAHYVTRVKSSLPNTRLKTSTESLTQLDWRKAAPHVLLGVLTLAAAIALVTRLPFVPYNIRELPNQFHPLLAPVLLAAFIFWVFGLPASAAHWLTRAKNHGAAFPLLVVVHALVGWTMLQFAVLPESIHDVIGSPVLNWPWQLEYITRFVPLLSVLTLQLTGGALIAATMLGTRMAVAPTWWFVTAVLLLPMQYWIIITQASTDNLTELIASNGSVGACLLLSCYVLLIGIAGSLLASLRANLNPKRIGLTLTFLAFSTLLGYLLLYFGTEAVVIKDQKVFSALQFLLSTDRTHYAAGAELWGRFTLAHLAAVCLTATAQYPLWASFSKQSDGHLRRELR